MIKAYWSIWDCLSFRELVCGFCCSASWLLTMRTCEAALCASLASKINVRKMIYVVLTFLGGGTFFPCVCQHGSCDLAT